MATHECPPGMQKAWKIKDGNHQYMLMHDGTKIDLDHAGHPQHEKDEVKEDSEEARNLRRNPLLTPEEEKLREEVERHGIGSTYERPGHGHEFGKELNGKVYFKATSGTKGYKPGLWVEDSNVKPKGLSDKNRPTVGRPMRAQHTPTNEPVKQPDHIKPGAVGLTARTNTAQTNPQTGKVEMEQGRANVTQTGLTGGKEPTVDTSETKPPVPPPLPSLKKSAVTAAP
jgi:hypothetical protein